SGPFRASERPLTDIPRMGFHVVYLPPIHPIGQANRKGPNNTLNGGREAVGSPWAIGNSAGGHTGVEPALGTPSDFDRFVGAVSRVRMEVALDFSGHWPPDQPRGNH